MLPATAHRVERATAERINRRIATETEKRVRHYANHPGEIGRHLAELDAEWDIARTMETYVGALAFTGTLLGAAVNKRFLLLPALVTGFLFQHALQGWCPAVPFFRKRGIRTSTEIERERYAIKALRGDFRSVEDNPEPTQALAALRAADA